MATFIIGLVILFGGAALYGRFCEKVFGPDDRQTPAYAKQDGVDFIPMQGWKNSLINLLNIAGTGPILGPIQGILFGPIAFITIPIGNVIGGAMHDYFSGMICLRDGGTQMPQMIKRYSNKGIFNVYNVFCCLLLLLVGAVFVYTPGDIAATSVFGFDGKPTSISTWIIYGVIFLYYLIATVFPIDAIIGRIYPIFGAILLFSAVGVFIGMFVKGYPLLNVWDDWSSPILRALRLSLAETFHLDQSTNGKRMRLAIPVFLLAAGIIVFAKFNKDGFNILWRYFAWSNQTLSLFAFLCITVWMFENGKGKFAWMPLIPGAFYAFICSTYIANAHIGFNIPWTASYIIGVVFAIAYVVALCLYGRKRGAAVKLKMNK